jgi:rRNA maturation RNase YbeY
MIHIEYIDRDVILNISELNKWLSMVSASEDRSIGNLSIVIGSDEWLLEKNISFLNHNYYTDIITFDYCEDNVLSGDLLISLDRVYENADDLNVPRETELHRVIVHGLLHLIGYKDKSPKESEVIRKKEDYYLSLL